MYYKKCLSNCARELIRLFEIDQSLSPLEFKSYGTFSDDTRVIAFSYTIDEYSK